jgi:hypothetical protein
MVLATGQIGGVSSSLFSFLFLALLSTVFSNFHLLLLDDLGRLDRSRFYRGVCILPVVSTGDYYQCE